MLRETLDIQGRVLGNDHADTLKSMNDLGVTLISEGRYTEAEKLMREIIEREVRVLGPEHPDTALTVYNMACLEALTNRPDAALKDLNHAVEHGLTVRQLLAIATDSDLNSLHGDPRFNQLVVVAKARASKP